MWLLSPLSSITTNSTDPNKSNTSSNGWRRTWPKRTRRRTERSVPGLSQWVTDPSMATTASTKSWAQLTGVESIWTLNIVFSWDQAITSPQLSRSSASKTSSMTTALTLRSGLTSTGITDFGPSITTHSIREAPKSHIETQEHPFISSLVHRLVWKVVIWSVLLCMCFRVVICSKLFASRVPTATTRRSTVVTGVIQWWQSWIALIWTLNKYQWTRFVLKAWFWSPIWLLGRTWSPSMTSW